MSEYSIQRLRGGYAIVWTGEAGKRRRVRLAATDRFTAEAEARQRWRGGDSNTWTVGSLMLAYMDDRKAAGIASHQRQQDAWKAMEATWKDVDPAMIDEKMARTYAGLRRASAATVRTELGQLAAALNWSVKKKLLTHAPPVWRPQAPERIERHLTREQFALFLEACRRPHMKLYATLGVTTMARPSAILDLTWDRVDFETRMVNLNPVGRIQTAKRRPRVPLNDNAIEALKEAYRARQSQWVIEHGAQQVASVKKGFQAASVRCGFKVTPYMLRHTGAVWSAEGGISMDELAQFMGHDDASTTSRHYARFSPDFLRKVAGVLTW